MGDQSSGPGEPAARGWPEVLARCRRGRHDPLSWMTRAISSSAQMVLALGIGGASLAHGLYRPERVVITVSGDEGALRRASEMGLCPVAAARPERLPFADGRFDAVASCLGLADIAPLGALLSEAARVLRPGGVLVSIIPTLLPVRPDDFVRGLALATLLRTPPGLSGQLEVGLARRLRREGLTKVEDARETYRYPIRSAADAELLIDGCFPGRGAERRKAVLEHYGRRVLSGGWLDVALPLRRIVAIK